MSHTGGMTRRDSLLAAAGLAVAVTVGGCGDDSSEDRVACVLTPEQTEGPYYLEGERVRRDITEGRPGAPLALRLRVVDATTCKPIRAASVDVWHCDALGVYSGVDGDTGSFMRGVQRTDARGAARFDTVYPGWYSGRAVHIHVKVHAGGNEVHTGQLYFPDDVTARVYGRAPYSGRPGPDVRNADDPIYLGGGDRSTLEVRERGTGYLGELTMGVRPRA
jgi:hypothetical protein